MSSSVLYSQDQTQFNESIDRFLTDKSDVSAVRQLMATSEGYDATVWQQLSSELGLPGIHIPEAYGGFGFGVIEQSIISEQMGRHLYCGPYFASAVMAGYAVLLAAQASDRERLLPQIADGSLIATLVLDDMESPASVGTSLQSVSDALETSISGVAPVVIDGLVAQTLVVVARSASGELALYEVAPEQVRIDEREALDPTRKLAQLTFDSAPARLLSAPGGIETPLDDIWDHICIALSHEMIGGAEHLFYSTIEYMKLRVQFGRQIGSFQALKHRCADLLLELQLARSVVHAAARDRATDAEEPWQANMAKAMASDAYMNIARQAIQLRGGIGFTWEEDTHLWFKRAKASEVLFGSPSWHRERMIQRMQALGEIPNV